MSLSKHDCIPLDQCDQPEHAERRALYECLVGCILYAAISTRLDITHAVNQLSRFMRCPGEVHLQAAKRVLRYLAANMQLGLRSDPLGASDAAAGIAQSNHNSIAHESAAGSLVAFADSDWAGCTDDRRSTTGFVLLYAGCPLSWISKKQATVALSSAEAEYMAIGMALRELKWMHHMLTEIGLRQTSEPSGGEPTASSSSHSAVHASAAEPNEPSIIYSDNQAALSMCMHSGAMHQRTKHIDVRHHFIQEAVRAGEVQLEWISTREQLADIFTKPLGPQLFGPLRDRLMAKAGGKQESIIAANRK